MFSFEHFVLSAAGAATLLAADFLLFLLPLALRTEFALFQLITQVSTGKKPVGALQAGGLAFDFNAGWRMTKLYAGRRFIDLLSAGAGAADKIFREFLFADAQRGHPFVEFFPFFLCNHTERRKPRTANGEQRQILKFRLAKDSFIRIIANLLTRV